jgi:hypothetical protein
VRVSERLLPVRKGMPVLISNQEMVRRLFGYNPPWVWMSGAKIGGLQLFETRERFEEITRIYRLRQYPKVESLLTRNLKERSS